MACEAAERARARQRRRGRARPRHGRRAGAAVRRLVVATGSVPSRRRSTGLAELPHWTSREATTRARCPRASRCVGGGAVGCELSQLYARLGARVTLVQSGDRPAPAMDPDAGGSPRRGLRAGGNRHPLRREGRHGSRAAGTRHTASSWKARNRSRPRRLLVATGRRPNVEGFGLERLDVTIGEARSRGRRPACGRRRRLGGR